MKNKIKILKDDITLFKLTELMLYESYKNIELNANKSAEDIANRFKKFINKDDKKVYETMYNYAKLDVEYMSSLSTITNMYNTFEQFLKKILNIHSSSKKSLKDLCNNVLEKFDYKYEENTYYEITEKYRMINNSIKHGKINENIEKNYPELINKDCNVKDGTILDNLLNITEDSIVECLTGLTSFVDEMRAYFENMGYLDN